MKPVSTIKHFKKISITAKFILWFLFIASVPLSIATYISYNSARLVLEEEVSNSLLAVAENKSNQVKVYLDKMKEDVLRLSHMSDTVTLIEEFDQAFDKGVESEEYIAVEREYKPFLTYYQKSSGYDDLFIIRPYGDIIFSVNQSKIHGSIYAGKYKDSQLSKVFMRVNISHELEISDLQYYPKINQGAFFIAVPVFKGGDIIGIIAAQMGNTGVSSLVKDYTGLGRTGETIIAVRLGNEAVFITPLRFDEHAAFTKREVIGSDNSQHIQKALLGESGSGITVDYRGREVLSAWKHVPSFRWAIAVKMDTAEVFASADKLRKTLLLISLILLFIVVIAAILIARSISGPIKELTRISGIIANGELSVRAEISAKDEIGELAHSFNQMTDNLIKAKANVEEKKSELEEQKKLLEEANKELDSFVYTASHDLRAPLRGITAFANFLKEDYINKFDEDGKECLREISEGTHRMNKLIDDLLALSRISRIKNPYEDVDINATINEVKERIDFDIKTHNVRLVVQADIPIVKCDRIKITEVFLNLINNAVKFSSKNNKENPRVEVNYADNDDFHKFSVKDNGIGIASEHHHKVFSIFQRLHTAKEYEGTGAGLSIVKRVIDDHGGNIWIDSSPGKGATFYFTIPKILSKGGKDKKKIIDEDI
ncbi:MAG TPA: HAMP domain-containing protein [Candidatus Omnitrophica bacterium]|nr:HAMP domain-containing protein [Candidatus Omnitrophota bacterium]